MQIISITVQCKPECLYLVTLKKNLKSLLAMKHVTVLTIVVFHLIYLNESLNVLEFEI